MKMQVRSLSSLSGLRIWCCCELHCSLQMWLRLALLWLWCRPAATALIQPLAWEPPCAAGAALKKAKKKKKEKRKICGKVMVANMNLDTFWWPVCWVFCLG